MPRSCFLRRLTLAFILMLGFAFGSVVGIYACQVANWFVYDEVDQECITYGGDTDLIIKAVRWTVIFSQGSAPVDT